MPLPPDLVESTRHTVRSLVGARLEPARWDEVAHDLHRLETVVRAGDAVAMVPVADQIARAGFEGAVRRRLGPRRGSAPAVIPTKRSSALPLVGLLCAALIMGLGWAIGGGVVLVATGAFALFILVVALTGTRSAAARSRRARRHGAGDDDAVEASAAVLQGIAEVERALDTAG